MILVRLLWFFFFQDRAIEEAKVQIESRREQLEEAKIIRENRQSNFVAILITTLEYHQLAQIIQKHPNRQETTQ